MITKETRENGGVDQVFQGSCGKWRFSSGHFKHHAAKRPEVGEERVHPVILEQLRGHVVRSPSLEFRFFWLRTIKVVDFLGKTEIAEL